MFLVLHKFTNPSNTLVDHLTHMTYESVHVLFLSMPIQLFQLL